MMTPEDINLAREWLATVECVNTFEAHILQGIVDTIEEALELAMEHVLKGKGK